MYSLPPYFRLTFCYCFYEFLREQELGTGRSPDTDKADSFHGQIRWAKLNDFAPDIQDAIELWALRPHAIPLKVISGCRLHVFFHQYVADLREERSENVLRTVSASPFIFDMTVSSTVQITFIFIGQTHLVFGKRVCTCVTKHSNAFRTFLNWLKNSKRVWHEPKLHILHLPIFANFDL